MPHTTVQATAAFIGPMCLELKTLALSANLTLLAYLLDVASLEAIKAEVEAVRETKTGNAHKERPP